MAPSVAYIVSLIPMGDDTESNAKRSALHHNFRTVRRLRRQCAINLVNTKLQMAHAGPGTESDPVLLAHTSHKVRLCLRFSFYGKRSLEDEPEGRC